MTKRQIKVHCPFEKMVDPNKLVPHPANPATHSDAQVDKLAEIVRGTDTVEGHGIRQPIIVSKRSGYIVAGHCRRLAALKLGIKWPVQYQGYKSSQEELAVLVADNKIAELSGIDGLRMADVIVELDQINYPLELTAIPESEIKNYVLGPIEVTEPTDAPNEDGILARIKIYCPAEAAEVLKEKLAPIVEAFDGARFI
jgi:hypothetical protein